MEIKFDELKEKDIITLIAWFVKKKGQDMIIHTNDGYDIEITKRVMHKSDDIIDFPIVVCPPIIQ